MKSFFCSATLLVAAAAGLPAQNTPPAPVPHGAGATAGSAPPAAAPAVVDPSGPVDPATPEELKQYGLDRYDKIVEKSPFNFKIVNAAPPPTISFAADLSLAGITTDLGKGIKYATIVDKKKNTRFVINTLSPNKDGIQLVEANRRDTLLSSTVLARKGGEEAEIKAEKQIVERKAVVAAIAGAQNRGGVQPGAPNQPGVQPGLPPGAGGPQGGPGRANEVQARINQQLQPPTPGAAPAQPNSGAPNVSGGGAGVQPTTAAVQATPQTAAPTVADQAMARQNPAAAQPTGAAPPQQNKRRVILPPPITTQ